MINSEQLLREYFNNTGVVVDERMLFINRAILSIAKELSRIHHPDVKITNISDRQVCGSVWIEVVCNGGKSNTVHLILFNSRVIVSCGSTEIFVALEDPEMFTKIYEAILALSKAYDKFRTNKRDSQKT